MIVIRGRPAPIFQWSEQQDPASFEPRHPIGKPTKYAVERGIAPPPTSSYPVYPWHQMEVGDSFLVPDPIDPKLVQNRILAAANRVRRRYGMRFRTHICREGVRVWRTE